MNTGRAFVLDDLTVLLGLDLADEGDTEAIEVIPPRRRAAGSAMPAGGQIEPTPDDAEPGPQRLTLNPLLTRRPATRTCASEFSPDEPQTGPKKEHQR
jgi:hypothetical protein